MSDPAQQPPLAVIVDSQHRALRWAAVFAVAAIVYVLEPLSMGIFLGTLFAFMAQPLFSRLTRKFGARVGALATVAITTVVVAGSLVGLGFLLASKGVVHARELVAALAVLRRELSGAIVEIFERKDDFETFAALLRIIQGVLGLAIDHSDVDVRKDVWKLGKYFLPCRSDWSLLRFREMFHDGGGGWNEIAFPKGSQFIKQ